MKTTFSVNGSTSGLVLNCQRWITKAELRSICRKLRASGLTVKGTNPGLWSPSKLSTLLWIVVNRKAKTAKVSLERPFTITD